MLRSKRKREGGKGGGGGGEEEKTEEGDWGGQKGKSRTVSEPLL